LEADGVCEFSRIIRRNECRCWRQSAGGGHPPNNNDDEANDGAQSVAAEVKSQDSECRIKEKQQSQQTAQLPSALRPQPVKINRKNGKDEKAAKLKLKKEEKQIEDKFIPYPEVREPTPSQKKRRQRELIEDKKRKIAQGFYQVTPYSDQDDTLKVVASLDVEHTEDSRKSISNKQVRNGTKDGEMGSVTSRKAPRNDGYNEKSGSSKEYRDNPAKKNSMRNTKCRSIRTHVPKLFFALARIIASRRELQSSILRDEYSKVETDLDLNRKRNTRISLPCKEDEGCKMK
uniref:Transcription initiation factor TFIID subunit 1 n=1 Tax=Angiostrongylus cantonensis TaxID=6313 RepID=A0A158PBZ5_ANGCA